MIRFPLLLLSATLLTGAPAAAQTAPDSPAAAQDAASDSAASPPTASVSMKGADGQDVGTITLTETGAGVLVKAEITGLAPGAHGFHFHAVGQCEAPFTSAGPHYNPTNAKHGFMAEDGPHVGDMPNLFVPAEGPATIEMLNPFVSLDKESGNTVYDEDGTALVIHAGPDDHATDPSGNSGDRIACGVIE